MSEEEKKRQQRLAKERISAARRRRAEGKEDVSEKINMDVTEVEDPVELREALGSAIDRRHRNERELMMKILDESTDIRESTKTMSKEDRDNKLEELSELRRLWRQSDSKDPIHHSNILKEAAAHVIETVLIQQQEGGESTSDEEVKVNLLSDLQILQDNETRLLLENLDSKDIPTLQSLVKHQIMKDEEESCENVAHVIFDKVGKGDKTGAEEGENSQLIDALEQKYETLKDKLLEAVLKEEMGEAEWDKLSDKEKQEKLVELKMKEKKLRQEGKDDEAAALFEKLLENDQVIGQILGDEGKDEEQSAEERERRKEKLREEREAQGLPVDEETLDSLVDQEEKEKKQKRRRNVLENLDMMLEDEKAALLRMLKNQHSHIEQEKQRQLAIAKLRHDQRRMKREEKLDSAALIITLGKEAQEFHKQK
ncbi:hypothetical protein FSP39_012464 [Pinctada imbricata]|uniref:Uncharacterized protein n=1 Tax=Pinctada imbricata TaxID=66713 RepID=A0AA88YC79_PINIB|nr:hypothetical protein FSP39_012464 [Pinctada imbricata]